MSAQPAIVGVDTALLTASGDRPQASLFSSACWVGAIARTYGFEPSAVRAGDSLSLFVLVDDIRGRRVIAFPFSDYCDPLLASQSDWPGLLDGLAGLGAPTTMRLLHTRIPHDERFTVEEVGLWHAADLTPGPEDMWAGLAGPARQNARRAERDGITVRLTTSLDDVLLFHRLHCALRRDRYGLLAQPRRFFEVLHEDFVATGQGFVLIAEDAGEPVAGLFLLQSGDSLYYKFNASTARGSRPNDLLTWVAMQEGHARGLTSLDFGFSDLEQPGLHRFKRKFAQREETIVSVRHVPEGWDPEPGDSARAMLSGLTDLFVDPLVPAELSARAGDALYRYFC